MTVYVTQDVRMKVAGGGSQPQYNLTPAEKFGTLEVLTPWNASLLAIVPMIRGMRDKLENFSDDDYLLAIGDPSIIATASMIAAQRNGGRVKVLKWDRILRDYIPVEIDTSGKAI